MTDDHQQASLTVGGYALREGTGRYNTPLEFIGPIAKAVGGFDLDPCASKDSRLARDNIRERGGLKADWSRYDSVWCNHPYGRGQPERWLAKAKQADADTVVTLSKGDPSTEWFRDHLTEARILWFPKRITFVGADHGADFANVLGVFGTVPDALRDYLRAEPGWYTVP